MRLRTTVAAALGALALVVTLPTSASATVGVFAYRYTGLDGTPQIAELVNPPSGDCVTLPEVADPNSSNPADSPWTTRSRPPPSSPVPTVKATPSLSTPSGVTPSSS
ncbi:hypothetical protein [Streptomyces sp. NPDC005125]